MIERIATPSKTILIIGQAIPEYPCGVMMDEIRIPSGVIAVKRPQNVPISPISISISGLYPVCFASGIANATTTANAGTQPGPTAAKAKPIISNKIGINQTCLRNR